MSEWQPTHQHYKGGLYREMCRGRYAHSPDMMVVYGDADGNIWVRFAEVFEGTVIIDEPGFGRVYIPRFMRLPTPARQDEGGEK